LSKNVRNIASKKETMRNGIAGGAVVFVRSGTVAISERERGSLLELAEAESVKITSGAAPVM
jgi:chemotaxis receptor (MCP) glutamine deamidase CheD